MHLSLVVSCGVGGAEWCQSSLLCWAVGPCLCRFFHWLISKSSPSSSLADSAKAVYISGLHEALVLSSGQAHLIPVSGASEGRGGEGRGGEGEGRGGEGRERGREGRGGEGRGGREEGRGGRGEGRGGEGERKGGEGEGRGGEKGGEGRGGEGRGGEGRRGEDVTDQE